MSSYTGTAGPDVYHGGGADDVISGLGGADTLYGGGGADDITGGDGDDILVGEAGNDVLHGGLGADHLYAGADDGEAFDNGATNVLYGEDGDDALVGGNGADRLYGGVGADTLTAGDGNLAYGEDGADVLSGYHATLDGGAGDDVLRGLGGAQLVGGAGADRFKVGAISYLATNLFYDTITDLNAAAGDRLDFGQASAYYLPLVLRGAITDPNFDLMYGKVFSASDYGPGFSQVWTWSHGGDTFLIADLDGNGALSTMDYVIKVAGQVTLDFSVIKPEAFITPNGTAGADVNAGTAAPDTLYGLNGDDQLHGGAERDLLFGNNGADQLWGDDDNDTLYGGLGDDQLFGGAGGDRIYGGGGSDVLHGGDDSDSLYASGLFPSDGDDANAVNLIYGENGDDILYGGLHDQLYGGDGNDLISGAGALYGEAGNDQLAASGSAVLDGGTGDDILTGSAANDQLYGGDGDDQLYGGTGADILQGDAGFDFAHYETSTAAVTVNLATGVGTGGDAQGDTLASIEGVVGSAFNDVLVGDANANVLIGGAGGDSLTGGAGADTFRYLLATDSKPDAYDIISDFTTGQDIIDLKAVTPIEVSLVTSGAATFVFVNTPNGQMTIAANGQVNGSDVLVHNTHGFYMIGDGAANTLVGGVNGDVIQSGAGDDVIIGGGGGDVLFGQAGADTFKYLAVTDSNANGSDGLFVFETGVDKIDLSAVHPSEVSLIRSGGSTFLFASTPQGSMQLATVGYDLNGNDILTGDGHGFYMIGDSTADTLIGGATGDVIQAGGGNDTVIGGGGGDAIWGGAGADVFKYLAATDSNSAGTDTIFDFQSGVDKIDLTAVHTGSSDALGIVYSGGSTFIFVDLHGDGVNDMTIQLNGTAGVVNGDILF